MSEKTNLPIQGFDDIHTYEKLFGLPIGYIDSLVKEDDWSVIVKSSALLESACANMLTHFFGKNELEPFFVNLGMGSTQTGKIAICSALKLIGKPERAFMSALLNMRNIVVHNAANFEFSIEDYLRGLERKRRTERIKDLRLRDKLKRDENEFSKDETIFESPSLVIIDSLKLCLFKIWMESVFAIRNVSLQRVYFMNKKAKAE